MDVSKKEEPKVYCEFCHTAIVGEPIAISDGLPYHKYHRPDKTQKPVLNPAQLANLRKGAVN